MPSSSFLNAGLTPFGLPVVPDEYNISRTAISSVTHVAAWRRRYDAEWGDRFFHPTDPDGYHCENVNPPMPHSRCGEYGALKKISASATGILAP
jgi:hypothetical protein